ncbi:MAG: hypothetical protein AAFQ90_07490, partial [Pseudomonadota bacterium]
MNSESKDAGAQGMGAKAAWGLLGAAVILAGASIGWNILSSAEAEQPVIAAPGAPPSIGELREAAEAAPGD